MKTCKVIVYEGPDKSGKATQSKMLERTLKHYGFRTKLIEVPYRDNLTYPMIYWMLRNGLAKTMPNLFQFVQFLNKFIFQCTSLLFLKIFYDYVILDRWSLSAVIYGDATGVNPRYNRILYSMLMKPNCTIILCGKTYDRNSIDDVYEKDTALQQKVKDGYYNWARKFTYDVMLINNNENKEKIHDIILSSMHRFTK